MRSKKKKKGWFSKILIVALILTLLIFTGVMIWVFVKTGDVPDSLVYSFIGAITGELSILGGIKNNETKFGTDTTTPSYDYENSEDEYHI